MPYVLFHDYFPSLAERETRTITLGQGAFPGVPAGDYGFVEMFCDEPGCDCRRVMLTVLSRSHGGPVAVIVWGWESVQFYAEWMRGDDASILSELKGPVLNSTSPQSKLAPALLLLAQELLLSDPDYVDRIIRHYTLFRSRIDNPGKKFRKRKRV